MRYWWVNQNGTYLHEVPGGYLWSPKVKSNGHRNYFYDTMTQAAPGDLVFSFCDTLIKAVGVVQAGAVTSQKPTEFGAAGSAWAEEGWYLEMDFHVLAKPPRPKEHIEALRPLLPERYSPLQASGDGNQGVYLTELQEPLALALGSLIGPAFFEVQSAPFEPDAEREADRVESEIQQRTDIGETQKLQLVKARRGQGLYRSRVELIEPACRVTGVTDRHHLRASHIVPWRVATDQQRLDGNNGLLLSPHIDHLFDQGFLSFADDGNVLLSSRLPSGVAAAWHLNDSLPPRPFKAEQAVYLAFHRSHVFRGD